MIIIFRIIKYDYTENKTVNLLSLSSSKNFEISEKIILKSLMFTR